MAFDNGRVRFLELVSVKVDEEGLDVVDELVYPREMEERAIDSLDAVRE